MTKPCIICVAITGSVPQKSDNPAVPITVEEQVESTHAAFEAVFDPDGTGPLYPDRADGRLTGDPSLAACALLPGEAVDTARRFLAEADVAPERVRFHRMAHP